MLFVIRKKLLGSLFNFSELNSILLRYHKPYYLIIIPENMPTKYKRILLKLSGEALIGDKEFGIDDETLRLYAKQIMAITELGVEETSLEGYKEWVPVWDARMLTIWGCSQLS
jgi:hypothetical protein